MQYYGNRRPALYGVSYSACRPGCQPRKRTGISTPARLSNKLLKVARSCPSGRVNGRVKIQSETCLQNDLAAFLVSLPEPPFISCFTPANNCYGSQPRCSSSQADRNVRSRFRRKKRAVILQVDTHGVRTILFHALAWGNLQSSTRRASDTVSQSRRERCSTLSPKPRSCRRSAHLNSLRSPCTFSRMARRMHRQRLSIVYYMNQCR